VLRPLVAADSGLEAALGMVVAVRSWMLKLQALSNRIVSRLDVNMRNEGELAKAAEFSANYYV
jgi:hypothetical protein